MDKYQQRLDQIAKRAKEFRRVLVDPQVDQDRGEFITDSAVRSDNIKAEAEDSIFDAAGEGRDFIAGLAAQSVRAYEKQHGHLPSDEMMASAMHTVENMLNPQSDGLKEIMDNATGAGSNTQGSMSVSDGLIKRNHQVALVVPTMLMSVTADMITHIPANYDKSEIFRIHRRAGSTFGDLEKGDRIDIDFMGQYTTLDQRRLAGTGNGEDKRFEYSTQADQGRVMPIYSGRVRVYVDRNVVAKDTGSGQLIGQFSQGGSTVVVTGTVDYEKGKIIIDFSEAIKTGIDVHVAFDVNIESQPELIPMIDHEMESWTLYPHESALASSASIQAAFGAKREFNLDLNAMQLQNARNLLSAEKDRRRLNDMYFFVSGEHEWCRSIPVGLSFRDHYEALAETLENISMEMMVETKTSGLVGMVCGPKAAALLKSIGAPHFQRAPGYRHIPQPHYVGKLWGYDLKEDPFMDDPWAILCYAKGRSHGDAGYVGADAISAINYAHPILRNLRHENTLYELAYRDLHPYLGRKYFRKLRLVAKDEVLNSI
ncbi:hypothetical protein [Endozoicomonas lisbonensis]|uniref:Capsid protein n=1 Tax=Endozoicomonas lisbonensis TaxID=3120522 RepID=A0ABV2SQJ7_9GAMM